MVQRSNQLSVRRLENRKRRGRWLFRLGMGMLAAWNAGDLMAQQPGASIGLSDASAVAGQALAGNPVWQGAPEAGAAMGPMAATPTIMGDSLGMGSTLESYDASGLQQPMHFQPAQPQINGHAMAGGDCFQGCPRSFYASFDAMWMNQDSDDFTLSFAQQMDGSDYQFGGRYTIGQQFDCLDGVEAVYVGPFNWQESAVTTGTNLDSRLVPVDGFDASNISAFNGAISHRQRLDRRFQSLEFNRRWWAWDILGLLVGFKGIQYKEDYQFDSTKAGGVTGSYRIQTDNLLLGLHAGLDANQPVSQRISMATRWRIGAYANFDEVDARMNNAGFVRFNQDDSVDIAGMGELGTAIRYRILPRLVASVGYEIWGLLGVATVDEQGPARVGPSTGSDVEADEFVLIHGATVGLEWSF